MLGPVRFFANELESIQPYAIAPWVEEPLAAGTPTMLAALRGGWFCSVFGAYLSEIFPSRVRAQGLGSSTHWIMNALLSAAFPLMAVAVRPIRALWFHGGSAVLCRAVLFPETRGISLEELQQRLGI